MANIFDKHFGALARRLREDAGLGVRALASELGVTYSAVARAERGDPALESLARKAVVFFLGDRSRTDEPAGTGVVADVEMTYGADELGLGVEAQAYISALLERERGWRRALVRGVMEEHGCYVETEDATAVVRGRAEQNGDQTVLAFDLDRGIVVATRGDTTARLRPFVTNPFERADRASWGGALEQLAVLYASGINGWARHEEGFDLLAWAIEADREQGD